MADADSLADIDDLLFPDAFALARRDIFAGCGAVMNILLFLCHRLFFTQRGRSIEIAIATTTTTIRINSK